ncbi:MAG: Sec-independent protein translocase protein TatB [Proteobacteria bacterium]|nr:Sec-independent protein translocase protein TatB [Pseudomonadota bacterium]
MFDIGWPELMLVMVVALIVIGPKELPNAIRTVMSIVRKMRMAAREFQSGLDDIARESGLDDVKRQIDDIDFYDPGEALKSIAESDKDLLGLDDDPSLPSGNKILDSNATDPPPDDGGTPHGDAAGPFDTSPSRDEDTPKTDTPKTETVPQEATPDVTSGEETKHVKTGGPA